MRFGLLWLCLTLHKTNLLRHSVAFQSFSKVGFCFGRHWDLNMDAANVSIWLVYIHLLCACVLHSVLCLVLALCKACGLFTCGHMLLCFVSCEHTINDYSY